VFCSIIILAITLVYAVNQTVIFVTSGNPSISVSIVSDQHDDANHVIDFKKYDSFFAFGIVEQDTINFLHDKSKVEWQVTIAEKISNKVINQYINTHNCTPEDYKKLYTPEKHAESHIKDLITTGELQCLDELDELGKPYNLTIYG
jgi:hypothetical protein